MSFWQVVLGIYGGGTGAIPPGIPGIELRVSAERTHYTVPDQRLHHRVPDDRLHYRVEEETH